MGFGANQDFAVGHLADLVAITPRNFSMSRQTADLGLIEISPGLANLVIRKWVPAVSTDPENLYFRLSGNFVRGQR